MTWQINKPSDSESPGLAPQQIRDNWTRLNTVITANHILNAVADPSSDGYHTIIKHVNQSGFVTDGSPAPIAGVGQYYTKTIKTTGTSSTAGDGEHLCFQRGTGGDVLQEAALSVCPIRAAVSFALTTSNGDCSLNWAYNVSSVSRTALGKYTINFEKNMPSIYYLPLITCQRHATGNENIIGQIKNGDYGDSFFNDKLLIQFKRPSSSDTYLDPEMASIIIFGG